MTTVLGLGLEFDPELVATVERALEPYKKLYPPEMVEHFRQEALMALSSHPYTAALTQKLKPDPVVQESGDQPTEEGAALLALEKRRANGSSGPGGRR